MEEVWGPIVAETVFNFREVRRRLDFCLMSIKLWYNWVKRPKDPSHQKWITAIPSSISRETPYYDIFWDFRREDFMGRAFQWVNLFLWVGLIWFPMTLVERQILIYAEKLSFRQYNFDFRICLQYCKRHGYRIGENSNFWFQTKSQFFYDGESFSPYLVEVKPRLTIKSHDYLMTTPTKRLVVLTGTYFLDPPILAPKASPRSRRVIFTTVKTLLMKLINGKLLINENLKSFGPTHSRSKTIKNKMSKIKMWNLWNKQSLRLLIFHAVNLRGPLQSDYRGCFTLV